MLFKKKYSELFLGCISVFSRMLSKFWFAYWWFFAKVLHMVQHERNIYECYRCCLWRMKTCEPASLSAPCMDSPSPLSAVMGRMLMQFSNQLLRLTRLSTKLKFSNCLGCLIQDTFPLLCSTEIRENLSIREELGWNPQPLAITHQSRTYDSWQQLALGMGWKSSGKHPQ